MARRMALSCGGSNLGRERTAKFPAVPFSIWSTCSRFMFGKSRKAAPKMLVRITVSEGSDCGTGTGVGDASDGFERVDTRMS